MTEEVKIKAVMVIERSHRGDFLVLPFYSNPERKEVIADLKKGAGAVWVYPKRRWLVKKEKQPSFARYSLSMGNVYDT